MGRAYDYYRGYQRAARDGSHGLDLRGWGRLLVWVCIAMSGCFWFPIEWEFVGPTKPTEIAIAISFGVFMTIGPAVIVSANIPWSAAGRLLQKLNARTPGAYVSTAIGLFLLYHAGHVLYSWWLSRPIVASTGMEIELAIVGLIATVLVPALLLAPMAADEVAEEIHKAELVNRYELQISADKAALNASLLRAQMQALEVAAEGARTSPVFAALLPGLVAGMNQTNREMAGIVGDLLGIKVRIPTPYTEDVTSILEYVKSGYHTEITALPAPRDDPADHSDLRESIRHQEAAERAETAQGDAHAPHAPREPREPREPRYATEYAVARESHLPRMWNWRHLSTAIGDRPEGSCRDIIRAWREDGLVIDGSNGFVKWRT